MINLIMTFIIAFVAALLPWTAFTKEIDMNRADQLIKKYNTVIDRPKSCPMESRKFSDLVAKIEAIKDALKGNCLKKDGNKLTEVLDSVKGIQEEIKDNSMLASSSAITNVLNTASGPGAGMSTISGVKFSALFSNISNLFKKNQCNLDDGTILQSTSDLIYDSTQLGIISGNKTGLIVAGGGFLISSALKLIDLIFKQRFDFDKPVDRQTFIKLNCSFYEMRRELDLNGALDIENSTGRDDFRDIKEISESIIAELKQIESNKANIVTTHAEIDKKTFSENVGDLSEFKKNLSKIKSYLQPGVTSSTDIPSETQKLLMMSQLAQDYDLLISQIEFYKTLNISSIPMLDDLFINEMKKFDPLDTASFTEAMNISARDFNESYRAKILFHIIRIGNDITAKENTLTDKSQKVKMEFSKSMDKRTEYLLAKLVEVKKVENRLGNIIAPKEYSGLDDGSENMVAIIDNYKKISAQLYGEWGDKFLKFATYKSNDEVKLFNDRYLLFSKKYGDIIKNNKIDNLAFTYLCQDAQLLRMIFKRADGLVQEGFDFVVTNKDIIYSDVKNYYSRNLNEEDSKGGLGSVEKVQRHYRSAILALKELKGEVISNEDTNRYLDISFLGNLYIGRSMLDVSGLKTKARSIQDAFEKLGCQQSLSNDLSSN
jgi:hypothetical protein